MKRSFRTRATIIFTIYLTIVVDTDGKHFDSALQIVGSHDLVRNLRDLEVPGSTLLLDVCQTDIVSVHNEAVRRSLKRVEKRARNQSLAHNIYRNPDGVFNNLKNPRWGATFHIENRLLPNSYSDGKGLPRVKGESGRPLPSARTVSVECFLPSREEKEFFDRDSSQLLFQTGQIIDHEIIATSIANALGCCSTTSPEDLTTESPCFPIQIEPGDRFFQKNCMIFRRAYGVVVKGVREQVSTSTSYLDLSSIYGSSVEELSLLRQFQKGLLQITRDNMLPMQECFPCVKMNITQCPFSGDIRVNEITGLTALHLVFHREHNRIAQKLEAVNFHWDDERLFQEARKINTAQFQKFIYYEFLSKVIGKTTMQVMRIDAPYQYDPDLNPSVVNEFGAFAFRFGHTLINAEQYFHRNEHKVLSDLFFRPENVLYKDESVIRDVLLNQARRPCQKFDKFFTTEVSDKLYVGVDSEVAPGDSFDLLSRNIQRGRDHGIRPYKDYLELSLRKLQGLETIRELNLPTCYKNGIYESIDDIDAFLGATYEAPLSDAIVGPTFAYIIADQFLRLKNGDRFFFETPDQVVGFKPEQLKEIQNTASLSALICRNTAVSAIQPRALDSRRSPENKKQPCSTYPDINFDIWREFP